MGAEDRLQAQMLVEFQALATRLFRADFTSMCYEGGVQLLSFISLGLVIWIGALQVLNGDLSVGGFVSFNALVGLANPPLVLLLSLFDQLQYHSVVLNRLNDVIEEEPEQGADHSGLLPVPSVEGRITLEFLGFKYGGTESPVILEGISVDVAPGTAVAVVGRSGSGKTTLAKCLAGLLEPTEGRILYDGTDMTTLDYRSLRRHIGFVLQENFLFSDSIARNIAFADLEPDMDQVRWAARVANADDFVEQLPFGYDTLVGETGMLLSGGQRQRIAIARAVYNRPPVLILDEATSSLDAESERGVKDSMDRLLEGRTSFVIAHRLSTIRDADIILVLERGRLVEQGTHDELMARRGLYFYLSSQQLVG
jgi:ATP-binding cassette subfamily B protein